MPLRGPAAGTIRPLEENRNKGGDDVIAALREIYDDRRVKVPLKVSNADRKIEEDLPIHLGQK